MNLFLLCILIAINGVCLFNLSRKSIVLIHNPSGQNNTYFGFTVHLRSGNNNDSSIVVSAPKANSAYKKRISNPGSIYHCEPLLSINRNCTEILIGDKEVIENTDYTFDSYPAHGFLGASLDGQNTRDGRFVACSPRWSNTKRGRSEIFNNGKCYWISKPFNGDVTAMMPLLDRNKQQTADNEFIYRYGQFGFSTHLSNSNGTESIFGAPGLYNWSGGVIRYNDWIKPNNDWLVSNKNRKKRAIDHEYQEFGQISISKMDYVNIPNGSYLGYSVSSGVFISSAKKHRYVASAPKYEDMGGVFIFKFDDSKEQKLELSERSIKIFKKFVGTQFSEYFGASVCVVDLNGDGLDDLLVGAPRHSLDRTDVDAGDEGAVYVYINEDNWKFREPYQLEFNQECSSQFGTSISTLGDLDYDGFNDVVVGAPYENEKRGAVYIYMGSKKGLNSKPSQYFRAKDIHNNLYGFGISVSRGVDIDDNKYNDLAVGSYLSDEVILIRSRPVATIISTMIPSVYKLNLDEKKFNVNICIEYNGYYLPENINISLDVTVQGAFFEKNTLTKNLNRIIESKREKKACTLIDVLFQDKIQRDFSIPVSLSMKLSIFEDESKDNSTFCSTCPVLHPTSKENVTISVPFSNGCANDTCYPEIKLYAHFTSFEYVIGSPTSLTLNICLRNLGEPAFGNQLKIETNLEAMNFVLKPEECNSLSSEDKIIHCIFNVLKSGKDKNISLVIDTNNIPIDYKFLRFNVSVSTTGTEKYLDDNRVSLKLPLHLVSDFKVTGTSSRGDIVLKDEQGLLITNLEPIRYSYVVQNLGSPIKESEVTFYIPRSYQKINFFNVLESQASLRDESITCIHTNLNETNVINDFKLQNRNSDFPENETLFFNCSMRLQELECMSITCKFGLMEKRASKAFINFSIQSRPEEIQAILGRKRKLNIQILTVVRPLVKVQSIRNGVVVYDMETTFLESKHEDNSILYILLAVVLGLLVLGAIIAGLVKYGFFHRHHQELMQGKLIKEGSTDFVNE